MTRPRVAFYAPMKPADHPVPSGDRLIAQNTIAALRMAGFEVEIVSKLRTLEMSGDADRQAQLIAEAEREAGRILANFSSRQPAAWFTYHSHYKAPDLLGPLVAPRLGLPYLISEPSISPRQRTGAWAAFAQRSEAALAAADRLLWTTRRDLPGLEAEGHGGKLCHLPAFVDPGAAVAPRPAGTPLRLLTVAMMRPGDKATSYRRLGVALAMVPAPWSLEVVGDGPARAEVEAALAPFGHVQFAGATNDPADLRARMERADVFVWPGVGEGIGMVWLEAQAASLPVVAEDGPAARDVVGGGLLTPPGDAATFAAAIRRVAAERPAFAARARAHIEAHHSIAAAAGLIGREIRALVSRQ